jgi:ABC-type transport system substrate-binding protein
MLPAHLAEVNPKNPDFLIGTGPFKFKNRIPGKVWIYERNPDYFFKGLPYLDTVEIYPMVGETAVDAFCGDRLTMAYNLRYGIDYTASLEKIRKLVPDAIIKMKPLGVLRGVIFNVAGRKGRKGPWQDVRVRRAMTLVTEFPESIVAGQGSLELGLNSGIVPPYIATGLSWKEAEKVLGVDKPMEQRVKEAKRLMKEAGNPDGFKAELITRNNAPSLRPVEFMSQGWKKHLNIQLTITPMENPVYFPRKNEGDFDLMYEPLSGMYGAVAEENLGKFLSKSIENVGGWSNAEYDRLYDQLIRETDPKKRAEISGRMQRIFLQEVPMIVNVCPIIGTAHRPKLHGYVLQTGHTVWSCMDRMWIEK